MANHDTYKKIVELMALSIDLGPKEDTNLKREVK